MVKLTGGGKNRNASPSSSEGNENISQSTKVRSDRSQRSKNFAEDELTALMALVRKLKPAVADQWEKSGLHLSVRARGLGQSWYFRTGASCRSRFDNLIPKQKRASLYWSCCWQHRGEHSHWGSAGGVGTGGWASSQARVASDSSYQEIQSQTSLLSSRRLWSRSSSLGLKA